MIRAKKMAFTRLQVLIGGLIISVLISSVWIYHEKKKQRREEIQKIIIEARAGLSHAQ
ncbi:MULTISPECIES: hypothetical protein [unclassified Acinetobacter]|uniref:hypothetical protein n=2 Tax=unclassified Acinetobacter TaxID=196816 RepID=UPI0015D2A050|nr:MULTISPECIES: hypothetical protein [unclassified Acinetobacter]